MPWPLLLHGCCFYPGDCSNDSHAAVLRHGFSKTHKGITSAMTVFPFSCTAIKLPIFCLCTPNQVIWQIMRSGRSTWNRNDDAESVSSRGRTTWQRGRSRADVLTVKLLCFLWAHHISLPPQTPLDFKLTGSYQLQGQLEESATSFCTKDFLKATLFHVSSKQPTGIWNPKLWFLSRQSVFLSLLSCK